MTSGTPTAASPQQAGEATNALLAHSGLQARRKESVARYEQARAAFSESTYLTGLPISIFCAGSMARMEIGKNSDLDLFVLGESGDGLDSRLAEYTLFAELIAINKELDYPPFSNDGKFLKIYHVDPLMNHTGSRRDDSENLFTARMLLMLESKPLLNPAKHSDCLASILPHYYRDKEGHEPFHPLFLLNDLLRYWRTLCLNYEARRNGPGDVPWHKQNFNLKFSRMMTVFATVLPLIVGPLSHEELLSLCEIPPLERLAAGLDRIDDAKLNAEWGTILDIYEAYLTWKEEAYLEHDFKEIARKEKVNENAECFSRFLYSALTHTSIAEEYRRYLVL